MFNVTTIDYKKLARDTYEGIVTGLAVAFIIINLGVKDKVMDYIRDIETTEQAQEILEMLDNQDVGHVYGEELGWNCEAC